MKMQAKRADDSSVWPIAIGLTGGIACGKSEVGLIFERLGAKILDADEVAHQLMRPGQPIYRKVVDRFGHTILENDGTIHRGALAERVFSLEEERRALNAIVHPEVLRVLRGWIGDHKKRKQVSVGIVPLLFETGRSDLWDVVVCVVSPKADVLKRLRKRGLNRRQSDQRIAAQLPLKEKRIRSDYVISNDGSLADLEIKTKEVWEQMIKKENRHHG